MNKPYTKQLIQKLSQSRNHLLINMKNYKNIYSKIIFYCNTCQCYFKTSLHSYKNAKKTGCIHCKKLAISKHHKNKRINSITRKKIGKANKNKKGSLKGKMGSLHPRWKGGIYNRLKGSSTEAYLWRNNVKKIYNNKCVLTNASINLECHHLESWDHCKEKRTDPFNGVLLAKDIHQRFHKFYGYGKNTEKQFEEFCLREFNLNWVLIKKNKLFYK